MLEGLAEDISIEADKNRRVLDKTVTSIFNFPSLRL